MTAVDLITTVGRPLDLNAVMVKPDAPQPRPDEAKADRAGFSFGDFIDVINPLQHIPGVAELYRSVTNDQISDDARKAGNVLYGFALGGPVGVGAMLAYNAVGDRLNSGAAPATADGPGVAQAATAPEPSKAVDVPVPRGKPDAGPVPMPKPDREPLLLGETVAATGRGTGSEPPISGPVREARDPGDPMKAGDVADTPASAASSVSYVDVQDIAGAQPAVVPNDAGLSRLATHQSNRLPLDVLKALQERHAERSASERS